MKCLAGLLPIALALVAIGCRDTATKTARPSSPTGERTEVQRTASTPPVEEQPDSPDHRRDHAGAAEAGYPTAITNSIGLELRPIPAGEFLMGSAQSPETLASAFADYGALPAWFRDERPQHRVRITGPFDLGVYEVTAGQFRQFVTATGYRTDAEQTGQGFGFNDDEGTFEGGPYSWRDPGFPQTDEHPVVLVSWEDAMAFCRWLGKKEGADYRLPTEAEWEYACRAGTTTHHHGGDELADLVRVANVQPPAATAGLSAEEAMTVERIPAFTAPVGQLQANRFGLYDMHGNAWEWCADWYAEGYYGQSPAEEPSGPPTGKHHVLRGGSFLSGPGTARSAARNWDTADRRLHFDGFRVVRRLKNVSGNSGK